MPTFYSEVGTARIREVVADVATVIWVVFWVIAGLRIQDAISGYASVGRTLRDGGTSIQGAGAEIGNVLGNIPLIGAGVDALATGALGTAGAPFVEAGEQVESLLLLIARLLAILVVAVFVLPWLFKYLPWRTARIGTIRAAHQVIRRGGVEATSPAMQQVLATRAINRLPYDDLLEHTTDPIGDYAAGRYERLARAELASVGLR